jgi:signal transduction histidine kinase
LAWADHDVLDRLILAEQDERRRLALFLHDGPVQQLSGIALMLDGALHAIADGATEQALEIIGTALDRQRATIRELRDLSFALEPVVLRDQGLEAALRAFADQMALSYGVPVEIGLEGLDRVGEAASIALYTILRELIEQALRRGTPSMIAVRLERGSEGSLVASVSDDAEPERRRRSIESIEERTRQLHGSIELLVEGKRQEVRMTFPAHALRR